MRVSTVQDSEMMEREGRVGAALIVADRVPVGICLRFMRPKVRSRGGARAVEAAAVRSGSVARRGYQSHGQVATSRRSDSCARGERRVRPSQPVRLRHVGPGRRRRHVDESRLDEPAHLSDCRDDGRERAARFPASGVDLDLGGAVGGPQARAPDPRLRRRRTCAPESTRGGVHRARRGHHDERRQYLRARQHGPQQSSARRDGARDGARRQLGAESESAARAHGAGLAADRQGTHRARAPS